MIGVNGIHREQFATIMPLDRVDHVLHRGALIGHSTVPDFLPE